MHLVERYFWLLCLAAVALGLAVPGFILKMVLGEKADVLLASQRVVPNVLKTNACRA